MDWRSAPVTELRRLSHPPARGSRPRMMSRPSRAFAGFRTLSIVVLMALILTCSGSNAAVQNHQLKQPMQQLQQQQHEQPVRLHQHEIHAKPPHSSASLPSETPEHMSLNRNRSRALAAAEAAAAAGGAGRSTPNVGPAMTTVSSVDASATKRNELDPQKAAFATFFYDFGPDSDAMLLATRVLMRSIHLSDTKFRKLVIVPEDGIRATSRELLMQDNNDVEIVQVAIPNVFIDQDILDPRALLLHFRNKLVLWDDPFLSTLERITYLDAENLVLRNMDEIFKCRDLCVVDNGQSVVYANSLLVLAPSSKQARAIYSDAIDSFMISGRSYNYLGITQGFLPGLFEVFEESPLFYDEDDLTNSAEERQLDLVQEMNTGGAVRGGSKPPATSIARRLPFYYSVNHMVYYERLNWDLYRCRDKQMNRKGSNEMIPGPLLSFKYRGHSVNPWNWVAYSYFSVFWHWNQVRETLNEDHVAFFLHYLMRTCILFSIGWFSYVAMCMKLFKEPSGRTRRFSSWSLPAPTGSVPVEFSLDLLSSRVVRKVCQISCNVLYATSSMPFVSSSIAIWLLSILTMKAVPNLMHPVYAAYLWVVLNNFGFITILLVYHLAHVFRTVHWKQGEIPTNWALLIHSLGVCFRKLPLVLFAQYLFLSCIAHTEFLMNPVFRPSALIALLINLCFVQTYILRKEMIRVAQK